MTSVTISGVGERRLQRHVHGHRRAVLALVQVHEPGLAASPRSGGGTITLAVVRRDRVRQHGRRSRPRRPTAARWATTSSIAGVGAPATTAPSRSPPSRRRGTFQYTNAAAGLANAAAARRPRTRRSRSRSAATTRRSSAAAGCRTRGQRQSAINGIPGFAGTVTVSGLASTGFTVTYGGASAGSTCRASSSSTSAATAASPRSRRRTTAAPTTRSRSRTTATRRCRS